MYEPKLSNDLKLIEPNYQPNYLLELALERVRDEFFTTYLYEEGHTPPQRLLFFQTARLILNFKCKVNKETGRNKKGPGLSSSRPIRNNAINSLFCSAVVELVRRVSRQIGLVRFTGLILMSCLFSKRAGFQSGCR